jgi:uncharacterized membrane protein
MNKNKILMMAAVTGLALGGANAYAGKAGYEKCKGVAPKGANGCGESYEESCSPRVCQRDRQECR